MSILPKSKGFPWLLGSSYSINAVTASCFKASFNMPPQGIALSLLSYPLQSAIIISGRLAMTY